MVGVCNRILFTFVNFLNSYTSCTLFCTGDNFAHVVWSPSNNVNGELATPEYNKSKCTISPLDNMVLKAGVVDVFLMGN